MNDRLLIITVGIIYLNGCSTTSPDNSSGPTGEGWMFEQVATGVSVGIHSSLTVTSDSRVHMAFHDNINKKLHYAERTTEGGWTIVKLDSLGWKGLGVTIEAGPGDTRHMAYQDMWLDDLRYARCDGNSWEYESIEPLTSQGVSPVILVKEVDIHIAEICGSHIHYRYGSLNNWSMTRNPPSGGAPCQIDMAIGPAGPVIAVAFNVTIGTQYAKTEYGVVLVKTDSTSSLGWDYQRIVDGCQEPTNVAIAYDGVGILHLLYTDNDGVLHDEAGSVVDQNIQAGTLQIDMSQDGSLWVFYAINGGLAVSQYVPGGAWQRVTTIQNVNPDGKWDLHVCSDGLLHVSFYDRSRHELWYARWDGVN